MSIAKKNCEKFCGRLMHIGCTLHYFPTDVCDQEKGEENVSSIKS